MQGIVECLFWLLGVFSTLPPLISKYSQSSHTNNIIKGNVNVFYFIACKIFEQEFSTHLSNTASITNISFKISILNKTYACMLIFHCKSKQGIAHWVYAQV